ncbi:MAG: hypothetical protein OSA98_25095 [Rubripirellula sp.]|nr:hypothetical protein [Rubripirellula sp.]
MSFHLVLDGSDTTALNVEHHASTGLPYIPPNAGCYNIGFMTLNGWQGIGRIKNF